MPPNNSIFYIFKHHSTVHTKQCLYIIPYFRVFCKRVTHIFLKIFIAVELGAFLHRLSGALELRQRVRPDGAAPFLHRLSGVRELRQRVRPFRAGSFSLNLSGECAYPAGAQEGRHLRFPPSCESPLSLRKHGEIFRTETIKERQRIFSTVGADQFVRPFLYLYAMPDSLLLHISATLRRRGTR